MVSATMIQPTPAMPPRVTFGLPFADYCALPALNWSTLKEIARSPKHYRHRVNVPREDRPSLALGRAAHTAVLEYARWEADYTVYPGKTRRGKEWDAFKTQHEGMTILTRDQALSALEIRQAVRSSPLAMKYLTTFTPEVTLTWTDPGTGFPCKARIDALSEIDGRYWIEDLKTAQSIEMRVFGGAAARYGYHSQLAWYERGARACGLDVAGRGIIAVESEAPYDVGVFTVDEDTLFAGGEECDELVARVHECFTRNDWQGRYAAEEPLQLPAWWYAQDDDADELGIIISSKNNNNDDDGEV